MRRPNACLCLCALALIGCGQDTRPIYATPHADAAGLATLKGGAGWYIDAIDGARVEHSNFDIGLLGPTGGNEVAVTAGKHHVNAVFHGGGNVGNGAGDVSQPFLAGHTYQFRSQDKFFNLQTLRVIDLDAGPTTAN